MPNGREERKETQPKSEAVERPWASNDKLVFDERTAHGNRCALLAEQSLQQLIEHNDERFKHYMENNRKTMSFLYDVEIPEAVANALIVKAAEVILGKTGGG